MQNGTVAPIQLSADVAAKFAPKAIAATKFNGQSYGVPYAVENIGLVRNTALAPEAPKTMDELVATGQSPGQVQEGHATSSSSRSARSATPTTRYPYLSAFDGGIFAMKANGDYDATKVIVNSPGSVKGAEALAKLGKEKVLSTNVDDTNAERALRQRQGPFFITGPWAVAKAKKAGIKYAISPLPAPAGGQMQPFLGVQMFYVSAKAKNAALAQEFVTNYVPRKDVQLALFEAGGRPPALSRGLRRGLRQGQGRQVVVRGRQGRQADAEHPGHELGLGPAGPGRCRRHLRQGAAKARFDAAQKEIVANIAKG